MAKLFAAAATGALLLVGAVPALAAGSTAAHAPAKAHPHPHRAFWGRHHHRWRSWAEEGDAQSNTSSGSGQDNQQGASGGTASTSPATGGGSASQGPQACGLPASGETLHMVATAYGPTLQDNYPYGPVDAFGAPLKPGDVAVDPRVIPLGTHLWVTGYHSPYLPAGGFCAVARDTGGAIKGNRIDLFINGTENQVNSFGIQNVTVTVLK